MAFGFAKTRVSPIAIDFGADSIKLLQVVPGDPPQLVAAGAMSIPEEARTDAAARSAFVAGAVRDLLRMQPFKGKRAVLSFPAFQTLMQHLEIGRAEGENMDDLVGNQLRNRLNVEPTRMLVRHFPVRQFVRDGVTLNEVICLAASRDVIHGYIDIAHACKLDVVGMHAEPNAILKAFEHLCRTPEDENRVTCFIDIGAATTKVVIAHGSKLVFAKSIHAGGDQITRQLAESRSIGFAEAYRLRRMGGSDAASAGGVAVAEAPTGIPSLDAQRAKRAAAAAAEASDAAQAVAEALECIVDELRLCLRYHSAMFPDKRVERLVFLGGEANDVKNCQAIAKAVGIAAQLGDPFARLARVTAGGPPSGVDVQRPQPGWAVPLGLSLSEAAA